MRNYVAIEYLIKRSVISVMFFEALRIRTWQGEQLEGVSAFDTM